VCCGSVSTYNGDPRGPALYGLRELVTKRIRIEGFQGDAHFDRADAHRRDTLAWLRSGQLRPFHSVRHGIESAPQAFIDMLNGKNIGKMVVEIESADRPRC
jgi:hypothetical protein